MHQPVESRWQGVGGCQLAGQKPLGAQPHLCILEGQSWVHKAAHIIPAALGIEEMPCEAGWLTGAAGAEGRAMGQKRVGLCCVLAVGPSASQLSCPNLGFLVCKMRIARTTSQGAGECSELR